MSSSAGRSVGKFKRIDVAALKRRLGCPPTPLVLDIRRRAAFEERPEGLSMAIPLELDRDPLRLPDLPRDRPVVAYCLCTGETSSSRVANWLVQEGYRDVAVLIGGLPAWLEAEEAIAPLRAGAAEAIPWKNLTRDALFREAAPSVSTRESTFLPRIAGQTFLEGHELPLKREMVSLFVDMVGSTGLVVSKSAEEVVGLMQAFMEIVIDVGAYHCGDVHDFEGDGALLYFQGPGEAVPAAFTLRDALIDRRRTLPALPLPRLSLDVGPVVIGIVGTPFRHTVSLVGPSVHIAARILKLAPPGGIAATDAIVECTRRTNPELARHFAALDQPSPPLDPEIRDVQVWVAPRPASARVRTDRT
jgi:class 3 adenylate cyclase/rhodanese-related sulfurtransferase